MLSALLLEPGRVELREVPTPEPGPGEIVLRVDAALTCGTDLKAYRRGHPRFPLPLPMGHEASGTVIAAGEGVSAFQLGDAVAYAPTAPCGQCRSCRRGRENLCALAVDEMVFGAFAEYVRLSRRVVERNAFHRPVGLGAEEAALLEPLACVLHGAGRVHIEHAEHTVLVGDGPIALLFLQVAKVMGGSRVVVVGRHANRMEAARVLGADAVVDGHAVDVGAVVRDLTGGVGADVVIECVGDPAAWEAAHELVASGGELLAYGGCAAGTRASFGTYRLHYEEADVKGAFHYRPEDVRSALELLRAGRIAAGPLITHRLPLERVQDALDLALSREAVKVALAP